MGGMWRIEPVPSGRRLEAIRFIVGGPLSDAASARGDSRQYPGQGLPLSSPSAEWQANALFSLAAASRRGSLWWAWGDRCAAAALVVEHPGRTGFLFSSLGRGPVAEPAVLADVVRRATREALEAGLYFVQASVSGEAPNEAQGPQAWGYRFVAELIHMAKDLSSRPEAATEARAAPGRGQPEGLSLRRYGQFAEAELGELILATYERSLDCPDLLGLRPAKEIIASHKAGGEFRPQSWWIADVGCQSAACILVNDRAAEAAAEVVYLGVRPSHRGQGLASRLIAHADADASRRGLRRLLLAVDSRNTPACRAYERAGFRPTHRRGVWAAIRG
jgi:mycothiol synthase